MAVCANTMKINKIIISVFSLFSFGAIDLYSQSNTISAGGQATGAGGFASYSIGQINYNTITAGGITISEGLQSAYEISTVTGVEETNINLSASVYPNPSNGYLILNVEDNKLENFADYKSKLQELVQTDKRSLEYFVVNEEGPSHNKTFTVDVKIDNILYGKGTAHSKKEAEQEAAKDALKKAQNG